MAADVRITCSCERAPDSRIISDDPRCPVHALPWPEEMAWIPDALVRDGVMSLEDSLNIAGRR